MDSMVVEEQMNNLIINMVNNIQTDSLYIDLILSGGAFNAIYLVGCLYFFKEMERKKKLIIHRISTCSASSFVALFYLTNSLDLFETKVYTMIVDNFKKNKKYIFSEEDLNTIFDLIKIRLYEINNLSENDILKKINYRLYITYFDIKKCKRVVKKRYKSLNDIFDTIKKSAHIPFVTMNCMLYENRYMDGWQPFIFTNNKSIQSTSLQDIPMKKKQLFVDLLGKDKVKDCIILKNNKKNKDKIMNGIFDAYYFFYQDGKCETSMCGYIGEYSFASFLKYYLIYAFSYMLCIFLYLYVFFFKIPSYSSSIINFYYFKISIEIVKNAYYRFIENNCL
jgi:hypothetical protein